MDSKRNLFGKRLSYGMKTGQKNTGKTGKGRLMNGYEKATAATTLSDEEITELYFSRDESAIVQTQKKYGRLFLSIAAGITGCAEDAMECVNDTYLKLWNSIPPERPKNLKAYGGRIARNLAINRAEYNGAERRGGGELVAELDESVPDSVSSDSPGEISRAIDAFLRKEDRLSRVTFVLRYWHCLPLDEISKRTGAGVPAVKSRLFRTRAKLKRYLEKEGIPL